MANLFAEKVFNINNIKCAKKIFKICPKFLDYAIINGETNSIIKSHPCIFSLPTISLPERVDKAAAKYLRDEVITEPKHLLESSRSLNNALLTRDLLIEKDLAAHARQKLKKKFHEPNTDFPEDLTQYLNDSDDPAMEETLLMNTGNIKLMYKTSMDAMVKKEMEDMALPIRYGKQLANIYLVARLAPNFAAACRVFYEIRKRCPGFSPKSLFDFGCGSGSATWAANSVWPINTIKEHFLVDASTTFLAISEYLLKDGFVKLHHTAFPNVTFRGYLPASNDRSYDIVVSSYSLLEVTGGYMNRRNILTNLWNKTDKFLVLIDFGTKAGFQAILEARDWLLASTAEEERPAQILAPCPHTQGCPKAATACTFSTKYHRLRLTETHETIAEERFSFVIFHKGDISEYCDSGEDSLKGYPRNVSYKVDGDVQDLCMKDGSVERYYVSMGDRVMKRYLKKCKPGDLMPLIKLEDNEISDE